MKVLFSNIIVLSIVVLCVESKDSSGSSAFRGGEGRGDRGARGEATRRSYQGPTDYNQYPQTMYSPNHPYQQYYPGHQQPYFPYYPYSSMSSSGSHQQPSYHYPYFPHYTTPYSSTSSSSSGASASSGQSSSSASPFNYYTQYPYSSSSLYECHTSIAEFAKTSSSGSCSATATTTSLAASGSVSDDDKDNTVTMTSDEIVLCPKQKVFIQTCVDAEISINLDVETIADLDPNEKLIAQALGNLQLVLDSITTTCDGSWESDDPSSAADKVLFERMDSLTHTTTVAAAGTADVSSELDLNRKYRDHACVIHMFEADDDLLHNIYYPYYSHNDRECKFTWNFKSTCEVTATKTLTPLTVTTNNPGTITSTLFDGLNQKDPEATVTLEEVTVTAAIWASPAQYTSH
mmetsp:Transcript_539/g.699  ORF Transcript_539/g.699 Transcript_539/m.699 type:complete len:404 (-) Transcript_539:134-1345(-)